MLVQGGKGGEELGFPNYNTPNKMRTKPKMLLTTIIPGMLKRKRQRLMVLFHHQPSGKVQLQTRRLVPLKNGHKRICWLQLMMYNSIFILLEKLPRNI